MENRTFEFHGIGLIYDRDSYGDCWPDGATHVVEVGYFLAGEATHICSLTPNSGVQMLYAEVFGDLGDDARDDLRDDWEAACHEHNGGFDYYGFIDLDSVAPGRVTSKPCFTVTESELLESDCLDPEGADYESELNQAAWNAAQEYLSCNSAAACPPMASSDSAFHAYLEDSKRAALKRRNDEVRRAISRVRGLACDWDSEPDWKLAAAHDFGLRGREMPEWMRKRCEPLARVLGYYLTMRRAMEGGAA